MTKPRKHEPESTPAVENAPVTPVFDDPAPGPPSPDAVVEQEEIARLAHSYWEERGCQGGSPEEDRLRAEQELRSRRIPPER